jgi:hypothetical protein
MKRLLRDHCKKIIALNNSNQEKGLCLFFKTVFYFFSSFRLFTYRCKQPIDLIRSSMQ